jgi:hypothetical protein
LISGKTPGGVARQIFGRNSARKSRNRRKLPKATRDQTLKISRRSNGE